MSTAEYQRAWRARNGARTGQPGRPPSNIPCGTVAGYKRHLRNSTPTCQTCREAWNAYCKQQYHSRKQS